MYKVIIFIGPSGSGKSTKAAEIQKHYFKEQTNCEIVSADNYFKRDSEYKFDASKLSQAHDTCKALFSYYVAHGTDIVIVDNTNTTVAERFYYNVVANMYNYEVQEIVMEEMDPDVCFARNIHNVPLETIQKQIERINNSK